MTDRPRLRFALALSCGLLLLATAYTAFERHYPYYFSWDMDLATIEDNYLLHSGLGPTHINHTGFGMYLALQPAQRVGHALGVVSGIDLATLAGSLSPVAVAAELTDYTRATCPYVSLLVVVALWLGLVLLLRPKPAVSLLALLALGASECFLYQSTVIRSETYSALALCAAILPLTGAIRSRRPPWIAALLVVAGTLLGLAYLTKMQSAFHAGLLAPAFLAGAAILGKREETRAPLAELGRPRLAWLIVVAVDLAAFVGLLLIALRTEVPLELATWTKDYRVMPHTMAVIGGLTALLAIEIYAFARKRPSRLLGVTSGLGLVFLGVLLAFTLHFALLPTLGMGWRYLLYDFKMVFLRPTYASGEAAHVYLERLVGHLSLQPAMYVVHGASLAVVVVAAATRTVPWRRVIFFAVLTLLSLVAIPIASRLILRDELWVELLMVSLTVGYCLSVLGQARLPVRAAAWATLGALLVVNLFQDAHVIERTEAIYPRYCWDARFWATNPLGGEQLRYRKLMDHHYGTQEAAIQPAILKHALRIKEARKLTASVLRSVDVDATAIGLLHPGMPVWRQDLGWRLKSFPEPLRETLVVDVAASPWLKTGFLNPERVGCGDCYLDYRADAPSVPAMAVLARQDVQALLFVEPQDLQSVSPGAKAESLSQIELSSPSGSLTLLGVVLPTYSVIERTKLTGRFFMVINPLYGL
jgi:hypothetical protein